MKEGIIFILTLFVQVYSETDFFASVTQLEKVYDVEGTMLSHLDNLIDELQDNISGLKLIIGQIKERRETVADVSKFLQNPLNSFVYFRSINEYLPALMEYLQPVFGIQNLFEEIEAVGGWPSQDDVEGAANAILRLQSTYNLDVDDLVEGKIYNHSSLGLSVLDTIVVAEAAYKKGNYKIAKIWMEKALEFCDIPSNEHLCDRVFKLNTTEHAAYTEFMIGNLKGALELTNIVLKLEPKHERANINKKYLTDEINNIPRSQRTGEFMLDPSGDVDSDKYYYYNCRGMAHPKAEMVKNLKCQYVHYNNPYLLIGPIKEEEAYLEPRIVILRDLISDSEILEIQNMSKATLERSKTQGGVLNDIRVSKVAWLSNDGNELVHKLKRRFGIYSDLSHVSAEALQVVNYGLGGHYLTHLDAFDEKASVKHWGSLGNRIATLLVYMNEVDEGGDTVFTRLGLSVKPEKGTAALWYNLYNSGAINPDTLHAACPVLLGTKWAINLWFHEAYNEFTKPCLPQISINKPVSFV